LFQVTITISGPGAEDVQVVVLLAVLNPGTVVVRNSSILGASVHVADSNNSFVVSQIVLQLNPVTLSILTGNIVVTPLGILRVTTVQSNTSAVVIDTTFASTTDAFRDLRVNVSVPLGAADSSGVQQRSALRGPPKCYVKGTGTLLTYYRISQESFDFSSIHLEFWDFVDAGNNLWSGAIVTGVVDISVTIEGRFDITVTDEIVCEAELFSFCGPPLPVFYLASLELCTKYLSVGKIFLKANVNLPLIEFPMRYRRFFSSGLVYDPGLHDTTCDQRYFGFCWHDGSRALDDSINVRPSQTSTSLEVGFQAGLAMQLAAKFSIAKWFSGVNLFSLQFAEVGGGIGASGKIRGSMDPKSEAYRGIEAKTYLFLNFKLA
jgi:hypothetical protein